MPYSAEVDVWSQVYDREGVTEGCFDYLSQVLDG